MKVLTDQEIVDKINGSNKPKSFVLMGRELNDSQLLRIARKSSYTHLTTYKQILTVTKNRDLRLVKVWL